MDAILDRISEACDAAFGLGGDRPIAPTRLRDLPQLERARALSNEHANYKLQVGDGVCNHDGGKQGRIEWIEAETATIVWSLPLGQSEIEKVDINKLDYMPTLLQIYGKDPTDKQAIRDDTCATAQIQREWSEVEERNRNCFPTPEIQAVAKLNHLPQRVANKRSDGEEGRF